jgi:hypothetical protein
MKMSDPIVVGYWYVAGRDALVVDVELVRVAH